MLKSHLELLKNTLDAHTLIPQNARVLIAISGGPDSVYLAFLLYTLGFEISLAHVNYGLRNLDSQKEEALVKSYADRWKVPIYIHRENPKSRMLDSGESLQQSARKIRYDFFERLIREHNYGRCALAHHADDQVESILMSLIKGNSDRVIHGMPIQRDVFVRPLIQFTKEEILKGLADQKLEYGHDISNEGNDYIRNKIRNQVLPLLEEINPSVKNQILSRELFYREQKQVLEEEFESLYHGSVQTFRDGGKSFSWEGIKPQFSDQKLKQLLIFVLKKWGFYGNDLWNALALVNSMSGKMVQGAMGSIYRERTGISFKPLHIKGKEKERLEVNESSLPCSFNINGWAIKMEMVNTVNYKEAKTYYLDAEKLSFPLYLRSIETGDKMQPLGMKKQKKLSDIMIDGKWNQREKDSGTVLTDVQHILAFFNFRISERVKVATGSKRMLKVVFGEV